VLLMRFDRTRARLAYREPYFVKQRFVYAAPARDRGGN